MSSDRSSNGSSPKSWMEKLLHRFGNEPTTKAELVEVLREAKNRALFDSDALTMMEGVLQVSDLQVRDIMIPRAQMSVVRRDDPIEAVLSTVIESAHSRLPVIGEDRSEVAGIVLAKDLLQFCGERAKRFNIRDILRSAVFVPESKRLNVLLKEFRASRNHMAIVVDEYGAASGLVTIEDVLEQIVGEIEDEHDFDEGAFILQRSEHEFTVKAHTDIEEFNAFFGTDFDDKDFDTIGGLVVHRLGHMPKRGERVDMAGLRFHVLRADSRKVRLLTVERLDLPPTDDQPADAPASASPSS
jgi:magnesium and cobalt transporter